MQDPINLHELEALARERLPQMAWDYYASGADDERCAAPQQRRVRARSRCTTACSSTSRARPRDDRARRSASRCRSLVAPTAFHRLAHQDGELATRARRGRRRHRVHPVDAVEHARSRTSSRRRAGRCGSSSTSTRIAARPRRSCAASRPPGARRSCSPSTRRCSAAASATSATGSRCRRASAIENLHAAGYARRAAADRRLRARRVLRRACSIRRCRGTRSAGCARSRSCRCSSRASCAPTTPRARSRAARPASSCRTTAAASSTRRPRRSTCSPRIVDAVAGRGEVLLDGGVRRGTDVVKALALGARAVLVGRPVLWGLAAGGRDGVARGARRAAPRARSRDGAVRLPRRRERSRAIWWQP